MSRAGILGKQRRHRPDYQIVLFMGLIMLIGLIVMYAIGPQRANLLNELAGGDYYNETYFAIKQIVSLGLAIGAFIVLATIPFGYFEKYADKLLWVGFGLCALLVITGNLLHLDSISQQTLGAYRWFRLGGFGSFQPAEYLKFAMLIYAAVFLGKRYKEGALDNTKQTVTPLLIIAGIGLFFIVVLQKDMGTGISFSAILLSIMIMSGMKASIIMKVIGVALGLGILLIVMFPHRVERVMTFLQGDSATKDIEISQDTGYHIKNAMIALGTGGMLGLGIGRSVQATGYLPEAVNDSVFAIIGETFGFVGASVVVGLFVALLVRLLGVADRLPDMTSRLVVAGVFGWLASHFILNIASMVGIFPLTGITLPLLSFGGTSMLFITASLGLVFRLSRYTSHTPVVLKEEARDEAAVRRRGIGGSRYSGRRRYQ